MATTVNEQIIGTASTLKDAGEHYNTFQDDKTLPDAVHESGRALVLLSTTLETAKAQLDECSLVDHEQPAIAAITKCSSKAKLSAILFKAIAQAPENSRIDGYNGIVTQDGQARMMKVLTMGMMHDVYALIRTDALKAAMEEQANVLLAAVEKMSQTEPSTPKEDSGTT